VIVVRALSVADWAEWRALRLAALAEAPYAFTAKLAEWQGEGDSEQRWRQRLDGGSLNLLADFGGRPAGMVSGMPAGRDGVEVMSMWVAPFARGCGVGDALVSAVVQWAEKGGACRVVLRVVEGNRHAVNLYRRHGFAGDGPWLTRQIGDFLR
jgi:GNAT superfamily N-acetyltransferase